MTPGLKTKHGGNCFDKFKCPNESDKRHKFGLRVLICDKHKNNKENVELLELCKAKYIIGSGNAGTPYPDFSKNIGISFHVEIYESLNDTKGCGQSELAIYMPQTITIGTQNFNLFFDSGCGDMGCKNEAVGCLIEQKRAKHITSGPIVLSGVGDKKFVCEYGKCHHTLPLHDGKNINLSGICRDTFPTYPLNEVEKDKVTHTFPTYPLNEVEKDIHKAFLESGSDPGDLPKLSPHVGGDTDLMIGIQYLKYYPVKMFKLPNGLSHNLWVLMALVHMLKR